MQIPLQSGPPAGTPSRLAVLGIALLLASSVLLVYAQVRHHDFVRLDDPKYIVDNPHVRDGFSWEGVRWALQGWHPLTWLSHMLDCELFGLRAGRHLMVNALLHSVTAAMLFLAMRAMSGATGASAAVAALFALHPLRVESVAWASERKDVLAGLFAMLALLAWARYVQRGGIGRYAAVAVLLTAGLAAKTSLVTLPLLLLLLDVWPLRRWQAGEGVAGLGRLLLEKLPLLALAAVASWLTIGSQSRSGAVMSPDTLAPALRVANAAAAYPIYLLKMIWPVRLAVFYPHPAAVSAEPWAELLPWSLAGAALLGTITALAVLAFRRRPYLLVGWLWYLGGLVPMIGLVQVGEQALADRYTYLPSIGIAIMVVWGVRELAASRPGLRRVLPPAVIGVLALLAATTRAQVGVWRDSETLFEHALRATRHNYLAHHNLGILSEGRGELDRAAFHYEQAVRIMPGYVEAQNNLGVLLERRGQGTAAIERFREAVRLRPDYARARANLGLALFRSGDDAGALEHLGRSVELDPDDATTRLALGGLLARQGRPSEAVTQLQQALLLRPDLVEAHYELGLTRARGDDPQAAEQHFREVLRLDSRHAEAHNNLGIALARRGELRAAAAHFEAALRARPDYAEARENLMRARAEVERE